MNWEDAWSLLQKGYKVAHRLFQPGEWMQWDEKNRVFFFEDGGYCHVDDFWKYRQGLHWLTDWRIVQ